MIWILLLSTVRMVSGAEQDSLFAVANQQYTRKNFEKAYQIYDGLVREGYTSSHLLYNYANTCLQTERTAQAIAYYEKALKVHPNDVEIQNNLAYARKQLGVTDNLFQSFWSRIEEKYLYVITIILAWITVLLMISALFLVERQHRKKIYYLLGIVGVLTVYFSVQSALIYQQNHLKTFAIALEEVIMYKEPATLSTEVYDIFAGQKVEILQTKDGWSEVITERNKRGWVQSEGFVRL